jgi:BirA family biotin operon repressor/biotin-[acetyl-CoA-carboxylase] ligase
MGPGLGSLVCLDAVDSTHAMAVRLISQMDDEGLELAPTVILAGRQSQGRGRSSRAWASPQGGLYLSWIRSGLEIKVISLLPMLAAVAAQEAMLAAGARGVGIKWPNDLLVGRRKLAGLVVHARHGKPPWVTVGLGVNIATAPDLEGLAPAAGSTRPLEPVCLAELCPDVDWQVRRDDLATGFIQSLEAAVADPQTALAAWRTGLIHRPGERMTVRLGGDTTTSGVFSGLTDEGFLRLEQNGAERVITSGDVVGVV